MKYMMTLCLVLSLLTGAPVAHAQSADSASATAIDAQNPYATALTQARDAYHAARARYDAAAARASWGWAYYTDYVRAYYALWQAYYVYAAYQRYYDYYERQTGFTGRVLETDTGRAVVGATVTLTTYVPPPQKRATELIGTRTTDGSGYFSFDSLAAATYAYSVTRPGFASANGTVQVRAGAPWTTIQLKRTHGVTGTVLARPLYGNVPANPPPGFYDPRPLAGVTVKLYRSDVVYIRAPDPDRTVVTGSDGRFDFSDIDFPSVRVVCEAPNYVSQSQNVDLRVVAQDLRIILQYNGPLPLAPSTGPGMDDLNRR